MITYYQRHQWIQTYFLDWVCNFLVTTNHQHIKYMPVSEGIVWFDRQQSKCAKEL